MTRHRSDADDRADEHSIQRRALLAAGGAAGAALVAGCTGATGDAGDDGDTGTFRLLVTDLPADIGDFDSLEVTLDRARVFRGSDEEGEESEESETDGTNANESETDDADANESEDDADSTSEDDDGADNDSDGESDDREFFWLDLDGATVDLTQVVGDKAVSVFEGELEAGAYSKVELHAAGIEGIVDGERVDVKIPSGKLQIVHGFEIRPDEPVEFVFDIHVVEKGNGGYNLRPVVSGSGVNGKDVDVEEIDADEDDDEASGGQDDGDAEATGDGDGGADNESADGADNESASGETGSE
ncbi:DUF4382 domain-containing protein [Natronoarchaeum mannanilyticum]|uniref:DUF4382 domain-containing protein n=1 Tax=Natronoarchaeum mannanilyticum TaxID=926360 RepID=A0AAV3T872_9EURY